MSDNSRIEWTDATWNPTTGCTKISPGCDHCYAETLFNRFNGPGAFDTVNLLPERLDQPLKWRKPRRVFVNSMSDLFHEAVPDDYIARCFAVMATAGDHTYQVLTKRHGRMRALLNSEAFRDDVSHHYFDLFDKFAPRRQFVPTWPDHWPLPNVWLGVSVEDQKWADIRIPALLDTPAAVRFLSCEPLLGPVTLGDGALNPWTCWWCKGRGQLPGLNRSSGQKSGPPQCWHCGGDGVDGRFIEWVIVGGESGPQARPMDPAWVRSLRDECDGAAFFFKQWGAHDEDGRRVGKHKAGRLLDGRTWDEYPTATAAAA